MCRNGRSYRHTCVDYSTSVVQLERALSNSMLDNRNKYVIYSYRIKCAISCLSLNLTHFRRDRDRITVSRAHVVYVFKT